MLKNEISMLEKWVNYLEKGSSKQYSMEKLSEEMPEYKSGFDNLLKKESPEEGIFQDYTLMLARVGNVLDDERGTKNLIDTLKQAKEVAELEYVRNPGEDRLNEIVACYSFGKLIHEGMPVLETINLIRMNFDEAGGDSFKYAQAEKMMEFLYNCIRQGDSLANPMNKKKFFSPETIYLTDIGEMTGDVDHIFEKSTEILKDKIKYSLTQEQTGELSFYYGLGLLQNSGISLIRGLRILEDLAKRLPIGPNQKVLTEMINDLNIGKNVKEAFSKQNYFSQEFLNEMDDNGLNLDTIASKYSEKLQKRYHDLR